MIDAAEIVPDSVEYDSPATAGASLRQAREAAGLHIAALAVMLKVPVKKLEALEGNRFELLPDAVFVRGLASSVCRTLKIDAAPVLALLPLISSPKLTYSSSGINEAFRAPGDAPGPSMWIQLSKPAVVAGLALLLGALVLVFLPALKAGLTDLSTSVADSPFASQASNEASRLTEVLVPASLAASDSEPRSMTLPSDSPAKASSVGNGISTEKTPLSVTSSDPVPVSASKVATPGSALGTSSPTFVVNASAPLPSDIVVISASGESWVEAADAKGKVVLRRMLAAGEVAGVGGLLPLKVTVGKANVTQVQIRGKGFDLVPVSKDNVARFEVK
jgi:cytoskeleton protein RodZ